MHRRFFFLLTALAVFAAARPVAAQKFLPKTIQFKGAPEFSDQELMAAAGLKKGVVLDYADMNDRSKLLLATGMFATLAFKFDGQDLIFMLTPSTDIYPIRIDNLPLAVDKNLDEELHAKLPLYHGKVPSDGGLQEDVRKALEGLLAAEDVKAAVVATTVADPASRKVIAVNYSIDAPPVKVSIAHVDGVTEPFRKPLQDTLDQAIKTPFTAQESAGNLERAAESFYQDQGHAAAKVQVARSGNPIVNADSIVVPFAITVQEGKVYKIGAVNLPSDALVTKQDVDKMLAPHPGGASDGVRLRMLWTMIAGVYKSKGYLDCRVTPHPEFDEPAGAVNYTVGIDPGPVYHLAFVKFDNVTDQMRSLLMHYWQMLPGDVFDENYVSSFILKAQEQDPTLKRSLAGVKTTFDAAADPKTHEVNVVIHLSR